MNKRLSVNIIANLIAFSIGIGINFFLSPYIVETVGTEAYGFVGLANNFVTYASLITVSLNSVAGRFIAVEIHKKNVEKTKIYFNSVLIANVFLSIVIGIISWFVIDNISILVNVSVEILPEVKILFSILFLNMIFNMINVTYTVSFFALDRLDLRARREIEANIIRMVLLILLFSLLKPSIIYIGISMMAITVYITISSIIYTKKSLPEIEIGFKYFKLSAIKEIVSSGIWNLFVQIGRIMATGLDLIMTNLFVGPVYMGVLSLSKTIPAIILSLFTTIANVFAPGFTLSYSENNFDDFQSKVFQAIKLLSIFISIPLAILIGYGDVFFELWVPTENTQILYGLSVLVSIELLFSMPIEPLWNVVIITNKLKKYSIIGFAFNVVSLATVFLLLSITDGEIARLYIIAGVSVFFTIIRSLFFIPIYGAKCLKLEWYKFYPLFFKNFMTFAVVLTCAFILKNFMEVTWFSLIVFSVIIVLIALVVNFVFLLTKVEKKKIFKVLNKR